MRIPAGVNESESHDGIRNVQERDVNRAVSSAAAFVSSKTRCLVWQLPVENPYRRNLIEVPLKKAGATASRTPKRYAAFLPLFCIRLSQISAQSAPAIFGTKTSTRRRLLLQASLLSRPARMNAALCPLYSEVASLSA